MQIAQSPRIPPQRVEDARETRLWLHAGYKWPRDIIIAASFLHAALGEEFLEPMDVVVAVDDLFFAHQRAEQR